MSNGERLRCRLSINIRFDRLLPQPEPYEDVRRHVLRVSRSGRNQCIAACRRKCEVRERGEIVTMNQVMSDARMSRLARKNTIQNFSSFFLSCVTLVAGHHPRTDE